METLLGLNALLKMQMGAVPLGYPLVGVGLAGADIFQVIHLQMGLMDARSITTQTTLNISLLKQCPILFLRWVSKKI